MRSQTAPITKLLLLLPLHYFLTAMVFNANTCFSSSFHTANPDFAKEITDV
jgi:hypothetical protein